MKIGSIIQWTSNTIPDGWLLCDGSAVSRTTYADLFSVIGTTYGTGDGSTTFNVPDYRGRVGVGAGTGTDGNGKSIDFTPLGSTFGEYEHTLTINEIPSHSHRVYLDDAGSGGKWGPVGTVQQTTERYTGTSDTGGGQPHNIIQPGIVTNYIIKALNPDSIKISELESANSVTSSDVLPIVQNGETKKMNILNMIYPIGSIYISTLDTNPSTYFGGVWQPFGQGRTLVGLKTNDEDFDTLLKAGGEKTHTLTQAELPNNIGTIRIYDADAPEQSTSADAVHYNWSTKWRSGSYSLINNLGGNGHSILQPYIVVSMWLRIG